MKLITHDHFFNDANVSDNEFKLKIEILPALHLTKYASERHRDQT